MKGEMINSKDFDLKFGKILKTKNGKNIAISRFDIENIDHSCKVDFIISFLFSLNNIIAITYKILHWEDDWKIEEFIKSNNLNKGFEKKLPYKNGKSPGIIFIDDEVLDKTFLIRLLNIHFNYEVALEPSQNLRIQLCVNLDSLIVLFDFYDDRGFDVYFINRGN